MSLSFDIIARLEQNSQTYVPNIPSIDSNTSFRATVRPRKKASMMF